jgi:hypothetical protein
MAGRLGDAQKMVEDLGARVGVEVVRVGEVEKLGVVSRPDRMLRSDEGRRCGCGGQACRACGQVYRGFSPASLAGRLRFSRRARRRWRRRASRQHHSAGRE